MQTIYIYFDDFRVETPVLMGRLFAQPSRGKEIFSFEFEPEWLQTPYCRLLDPDLQLFRGRQFLADDKANFGIFTRGCENVGIVDVHDVFPVRFLVE